eukprot:4835431-Lingulodinium_polyedra.AAC.1
MSFRWTSAASSRGTVMPKPGRWCPASVARCPTPSGGASSAGAPRMRSRSSRRRSTEPRTLRSHWSATEEASESRPHSCSPAMGHSGSSGVLPQLMA